MFRDDHANFRRMDCTSKTFCSNLASCYSQVWFAIHLPYSGDRHTNLSLKHKYANANNKPLWLCDVTKRFARFSFYSSSSKTLFFFFFLNAEYKKQQRRKACEKHTGWYNNARDSIGADGLFFFFCLWFPRHRDIFRMHYDIAVYMSTFVVDIAITAFIFNTPLRVVYFIPLRFAKLKYIGNISK